MSSFNISPVLFMPNLYELINTDPDAFISSLSSMPDGFSLEMAKLLDDKDPLAYLRKNFRFGDLTPFAGHSLGPVFEPAIEKIALITELQSLSLHEGHFSSTRAQSGNWFDYDIDPEAIEAIQPMLGFADACEFIYTQEGLSANIGRMLSTFYRPSKSDWVTGKTDICYLQTEFFSDQAVIHSVLEGGIQTADNFGLFPKKRNRPDPDELCLKIQPDARGLYNEDSIIEFVKMHANKIAILHLSDIIFSTGQRLDIPRILMELSDILQHNNIIVGLDLAHTAGNRPIDLKSLPVTYAVGCSYKHICGSAGSGFGLYVSMKTDLSKYPPIQGWKAAKSDRVFPIIDGYNRDIMSREGAVAFRCSNPSPVALAPVQEYMKTMHEIGWKYLMARSESMTRYMLTLLNKTLSDKIEFITPLDPGHRGAMLVFRIRHVKHIDAIETMLKEENPMGRYEVDTRPPNNMRITAHYGYTRFEDIYRLAERLEQVINLQLSIENTVQPKSPREQGFFGISRQTASSSSTVPELIKAIL